MTTSHPLAVKVSAALTAILVVGGLLTACTANAGGTPPSASATADALSSRVNALLKQGIDAANAGQTEVAVTTFNNILIIDPGNKFAYYNLGVVAQAASDGGSAVKFYDKALVTDPNYTPALFNKAVVLETTDAAGAIKLYQQIVGIDPKASTAYLRLSFLLDAQGNTADAAAAKAKAVAIDPALASVSPPAAPEPDPAPTPSKKP